MLVLGVDAGGTGSRAVVTTTTGEVVAHGAAGPGNPVRVPVEEAVEAIGRAAAAALSTMDPAGVQAVAVGMSGSSRLAEPAVAQAFAQLWDRLGLRCEVRVLGDVVTAFGAGTDRRGGTVVIAGTGAIAAEVRDDAIVRTADGLGWLLGDLGSGFWLGREAVAATARALYAGAPPTALTRLVVAALCDDVQDADTLVRAAHAAPHTLGRVAPVVTEAALAGDATACALIDRAADHLAATVAVVRPAQCTDPVVLAGGVLAGCSPLRDALRTRLTSLWPAAPITDAGPGELGAARIAARLF